MNPILQVFYSVFSGATLSMALPNEFYYLGSPFLSFFALIPFYLSIKNSKNYRMAFFSGLLFSGTTHLCSSFWLANFKDFAALTLGGSCFAEAMVGGFVSLFMYLPFANSYNRNPIYQFTAKQKFYDSTLFRIVYFACIYTLYEWVKSCGFLGYPWATLSSTIFRWPELMQLASITGTYGIAFLLCLINAILAEFYVLLKNNDFYSDANRIKDLKIVSKFTLILFALALIHGFYNYNKKLIPQKTLQTIVVQQNSNPWEEKDDETSVLVSEELTLEQFNLLKEKNITPELVVWSEGTLRYRFPDSYKHYSRSPDSKPLVSFIKDDIKTPLLSGGSYVKSKKKKIYFNSAVMFDEKGNYRGVYGKNHLVPFAEALPFMEIPAVNEFMSKVVGISAGWTPGDQYVLFEIPGTYHPDRKLEASKIIDITVPYQQQKLLDEEKPKIKVAAPICFDDAFPDVMRPLFKNGAELFVNLTDDSWSRKKSSEYQHCIVASYRSIELRTTLVRCCNAGYSVVFNPQGRILEELPLFEKAAFSYNVPVYQRKVTTYARFGNWLPWTIFILTVIFSVYMRLEFIPDDYIPGTKKIKVKLSSKKNKKKKSKKSKKQSKK